MVTLSLSKNLFLTLRFRFLLIKSIFYLKNVIYKNEKEREKWLEIGTKSPQLWLPFTKPLRVAAFACLSH